MISCTLKDTATRRYSAPALGNGDLSLLIDYEGIMPQSEASYGKLIPGIRRAGFRYDSVRGELIPFGYFLHELDGLGKVIDFRQSLDQSNGMVESCCSYSEGTVIEAASFCSLTRNIIALRRRVKTALSAKYRMRYFFQPKRSTLRFDGTDTVFYDVDAIRRIEGFVRLELLGPGRIYQEGGAFVVEPEAPEFTLLLRYDDNAPADFESLLAESTAAWSAYWKEGYVKIPSRKVQEMYDVAQYHLRISSTRWSLPTGIFDSHWHGRYHSFDEYFTFMGLAGSGHLSTALKIPQFRRSLFEIARRRIEGDKPRSRNGIICYPWETNEIGEENSPRGFWYDHVFQASHIALTAYNAFRFSGDVEKLRRDWYCLISGSVEWLRAFHIIPGKNGTAVIGNCTDLERLGPVRYNPFMTSCSAIAALQAAAETATILGEDSDLISVWRRLAQELRSNLPRNASRYLPYEGCSEDVHTIGLLSGVYPYAVLDAADPLMQNSITDYQESKKLCGNMYEVGKGICSWYQCWEAITEARLGHGDRALELLESLAEQTGCFREMYEIYECGFRPWFTTAEGEMVHALNTMLLQFDGDSPRFAPAVPASWRDFSFKLQCLNGSTFEKHFADGRLIQDNG